MATFSGHTIATMRQRAEQRLGKSLAKLRPAEAAVMMFLRERLAQVGEARGGRRASSLARPRRARGK